MADGNPGGGEVRVQITELSVCALPEGHPQEDAYTIVVAYRGHNRWAVRRMGRYLSGTGAWDVPAAEAEVWRETHLFDHDTAVALAVRAAGVVEHNGQPARDVAAEERRHA